MYYVSYGNRGKPMDKRVEKTKEEEEKTTTLDARAGFS